MKSVTNTVIVGAGPYGLSLGAHLHAKRVPFRIFGRPMDTWLSHMPKGMLLKSDGFASNLYDPDSAFTLGHFCRENGIAYQDTGVPVQLETFSAYGMAFRERMVPELDERTVVGVDQAPAGFTITLEDGDTVEAAKVVLAVGITHFEYLPESLSKLPEDYVTHSARHADLERFRGMRVLVIGGGASALDLAALLHEAGANVELVARTPELKFHSKAVGTPSLWHKLRRPPSGLGPGWKSRFFANHPLAFHYLPEDLRLEAVRRALGPAGGVYIRDKVVGVVPLHLGCQVQDACVRDRKVALGLASGTGERKEIVAEHVIAATGYKVNMERLAFLDSQIRSCVKTVNGSPLLSSRFESTVPGLFFVGLAAASSFGPVMRFAFGAGFAARTVAKAVAMAAVRGSLTEPSAASATTAR